MNSSGTTAGFQAQILWSKESAALFRICLHGSGATVFLICLATTGHWLSGASIWFGGRAALDWFSGSYSQTP